MVVEIRPRFEKELRKTPQYIQAEAWAVVEKLAAAKSLEKSGVDYKKLKGQKKGQGYYRIRVGDYRIGIQYLHPDVVVITILARGSAFDKFPPK